VRFLLREVVGAELGVAHPHLREQAGSRFSPCDRGAGRSGRDRRRTAGMAGVASRGWRSSCRGRDCRREGLGLWLGRERHERQAGEREQGRARGATSGRGCPMRRHAGQAGAGEAVGAGPARTTGRCGSPRRVRIVERRVQRIGRQRGGVVVVELDQRQGQRRSRRRSAPQTRQPRTRACASTANASGPKKNVNTGSARKKRISATPGRPADGGTPRPRRTSPTP